MRRTAATGPYAFDTVSAEEATRTHLLLTITLNQAALSGAYVPHRYDLPHVNLFDTSQTLLSTSVVTLIRTMFCGGGFGRVNWDRARFSMGAEGIFAHILCQGMLLTGRRYTRSNFPTVLQYSTVP